LLKIPPPLFAELPVIVLFLTVKFSLLKIPPPEVLLLPPVMTKPLIVTSIRLGLLLLILKTLEALFPLTVMLRVLSLLSVSPLIVTLSVIVSCPDVRVIVLPEAIENAIVSAPAVVLAEAIASLRLIKPSPASIVYEAVVR
jgi:hypothetical protein